MKLKTNKVKKVKKARKALCSLILCNLAVLALSAVSPSAFANTREDDDDCYVLWGELDYLAASFKKAPLPVALVTTSTPADGGVIGRPSTQVLFGNKPYSTKFQNGFNFTVGRWFEECRDFGLEFSGFYFRRRNASNFNQTTSNSDQVLAVPFNDVTPAVVDPGAGGIDPAFLGTGVVGGGTDAPNSLLVSGNGNPGSPGGTITINSSSQLWGGEINGLTELYNECFWNMNLLYGFRFIELKEHLRLDTLTFENALGTTETLRNPSFTDIFNTRNQFFGVQLGVNGEWRYCNFFLNGTAKVAFGRNREQLDVEGNFSDPLPFIIDNFGSGSDTGGIFAQATNIGRFGRTKSTFVPELKLQAGYEFLKDVRFVVGYFCTFIDKVIRPGNQIDPNINLTQFGSGPNGVLPVLTGPASPAPLFRQSHFWAQGFSVGFQMRY